MSQKNQHNAKDIKTRLAAKLKAQQKAEKKAQRKADRNKAQIKPAGPPQIIEVPGDTPQARAENAMNMIRDIGSAGDLDRKVAVIRGALFDTKLVKEAEELGMDPAAHEGWMRGFCATMDQHVYTLQEALMSTCLALGKGNHDDDDGVRMHTPRERSQILNKCIHLLEEDAGNGGPCHSIAEANYVLPILHDCLDSLTITDCLTMGEEDAWKLCKVTLLMAAEFPIPVRLAPLAVRWVQRTLAERKYHEHVWAAYVVATFFAGQGYPSEAVRFAERGFACMKTAGVRPDEIAKTTVQHAEHLVAAGQPDIALELCRDSIASATASPRQLPATLLIDIHAAASRICLNLNRLDEMSVHMTAITNALNRTVPPFDGTPEKLRRTRSLHGYYWARLLGAMKCFPEALEALSGMAPLERIAIHAANGETPDQYEQRLRGYLFRDRDEVDTCCDWRMCKGCRLIAKNMLHCPCSTVWYCGKECQTKDWKRHSPDCMRCWACDKVGFDFLCCTGCYSVRYCSEACSVTDWPVHKEFCDVPPEPAESAHKEFCDVPPGPAESCEMKCEILNPIDHPDIFAHMMQEAEEIFSPSGADDTTEEEI